jgi:G3E family GTPase
MPSTRKIPIVLVTGFLGTGKTTLLRRWMRDHAQRRLAYLVNEFSPTDVDGAILAADDDKVVTVPGGSIFCTCLVTEFIGRLRTLHEKHHTIEAPLEMLIIEASGMANPRVVGDMLRETGLDAHYELHCVLTLVSPQTFPKLMVTLPNVTAQVEAANLIAINRIDTATPEQLADTEAHLTRIAPDTPTVKTQFAELELDALPATADPELHGEYAKCRDPNYTSTAVAFDTTPNLEALLNALRDVTPQLYRAKGVILTDQGPQLIEMADGAVTTQTTALPPTPNGLVIIAPGTTDINTIAKELKAHAH